MKKLQTPAKSAKPAPKAAKAALTKVANARPTPDVPVVKNTMNRTELYDHIADKTSMARKEVKSVLDEFAAVMMGSVRKGGAGEFSLPGVLKIKLKKIPATKDGEKKNPFTGEPAKGRPARIKVRILPMAKLKDCAGV